jgi:hypothetical protein
MTRKLRTYRTKARAESYANKLRARFPQAEFTVEYSTLWSHPWCYLIKVTKGDRTLVGGAWVGR